jgi:hypothetical protein
VIKLRKRLLSTVVISATLASLLTVSVVLARFNMGEHGGGKYKTQAGQSNTAHLYLFEKDPDSWNIVKRGAWGKMRFNFSGTVFSFVFNGHKLQPGENYTLIYYPDKTGNPWPRTDIIFLGNGTANKGGNVHIADSLELNTDLPSTVDINVGAKIWLVLSTDLNFETNTMFGWNPTEYLFEHNPITYDDTDV